MRNVIATLWNVIATLCQLAAVVCLCVGLWSVSPWFTLAVPVGLTGWVLAPDRDL